MEIVNIVVHRLFRYLFPYREGCEPEQCLNRVKRQLCTLCSTSCNKRCKRGSVWEEDSECVCMCVHVRVFLECGEVS